MWAAQCVNLTQLLMSDCHMKGRLHSFCGIVAKKRGRFVYLFDLNRPHPMPFKSQHECGIRRVQLRLIFGSMAAFI